MTASRVSYRGKFPRRTNSNGFVAHRSPSSSPIQDTSASSNPSPSGSPYQNFGGPKSGGSPSSPPPSSSPDRNGFVSSESLPGASSSPVSPGSPPVPGASASPKPVGTSSPSDPGERPSQASREFLAACCLHGVPWHGQVLSRNQFLAVIIAHPAATSAKFLLLTRSLPLQGPLDCPLPAPPLYHLLSDRRCISKLTQMPIFKKL